MGRSCFVAHLRISFPAIITLLLAGTAVLPWQQGGHASHTHTVMCLIVLSHIRPCHQGPTGWWDCASVRQLFEFDGCGLRASEYGSTHGCLWVK